MADNLPGGGDVPSWLAAMLAILTTIAGMKGLGPVARWAGKRFDLVQQVRAAERADIVRQLTADLTKAREEMVAMRLELAEERELRMTLATENAVLTERLDGLSRTLAEDKRDCQAAIRALRNEIRLLRRAAGLGDAGQ